MTSTTETREQCLGRAAEWQWLADNSPNPRAAARAWDQARLWRSLALIARPSQPSEAERQPEGRARPLDASGLSQD
jgi:hypothetical protein